MDINKPEFVCRIIIDEKARIKNVIYGFVYKLICITGMALGVALIFS